MFSINEIRDKINDIDKNWFETTDYCVNPIIGIIDPKNCFRLW